MSEADHLQQQRDECTALKSGAVQNLRAQSLADLPRLLIQARIARRLAQRELAERLGMKEPQIQRYEAEGYAQASLTRLNQVAEALPLEMEGAAELR